MPNRFNAKGKQTYGQSPLPTGYSNDNGSNSNFSIPSVGIEDVDIALFTLFDKELPLTVGGVDGASLKKIPVIFVGGEKWALLKRNRPIRDKNGSLILPLITIGRTSFQQSASDDIVGRGINQRTGEIVIRRRLDRSDRNYQNLVNRTFLKHQDTLAVGPDDADAGQVSTTREVGELNDDPTITDGGLLIADKLNNVFETLVVPSPEFVTINYEVTVWTQYVTQMNQTMHAIISSFLPQTQGWQLNTPQGYWFVATLADETFNSDNNFDDMSQGERIIKTTFNLKVPAYILASSAPGVPVPVKRYVSTPSIEFTTAAAGSVEQSSSDLVDDPFLGADDPTLPLADGTVRRRDQRDNRSTRLYVMNGIDPNDPALQSLRRGTIPNKCSRVITRNSSGQLTMRYTRVTSQNPYTGETSYATGDDIGDLSIVVLEER